LEKKCHGEKAIRRNYPNVADKIITRLQDLIKHPNLKEYLDNAFGNPHPLRGNLSGLFWVHINASQLIIFEPIEEMPLDENGNPDYSQITAVKILKVNLPESNYTS